MRLASASISLYIRPTAVVLARAQRCFTRAQDVSSDGWRRRDKGLPLRDQLLLTPGCARSPEPWSRRREKLTSTMSSPLACDPFALDINTRHDALTPMLPAHSTSRAPYQNPARKASSRRSSPPPRTVGSRYRHCRRPRIRWCYDRLLAWIKTGISLATCPGTFTLYPRTPGSSWPCLLKRTRDHRL